MRAMRGLPALPGALTLAVCALSAATTAAQFPAFHENDAFVASTTGPGERFGESLAFDGNTAVVGVDKNSDESLGGYILERGVRGWADVLTLSLDLPDPCGFGAAVALDGGRAIMADPYYGSGGFCDGFGVLARAQKQFGSWVGTGLQGGVSGTLIYGVALAMRGDHLLVGACGYNGSPGISEAPVAVFHRFDGGIWSTQQVFDGSDTEYSDDFGVSVAMSADGLSAVVGAQRATVDGESSAGAAYVFRYDGNQWVEQQKLVAGDPSNDDHFGRAVAIEGDWIAVGSPWDDTSSINAGSVYVFHFDGAQWNQVQNFGAPGAQAGGSFGQALSMTDDLLAVGSFMNAAFLYRRQASGFVPLQRLEKSPGIAGGSFGGHLALSGQRVLVSDSSSDLAGSGSGGVFEFRVQELALTADAASVASGDEVRLTVSGGVPGAAVAITYQLRSDSPGISPPSIGTKTFGSFGPEGRSQTTLSVPAGLAATTIQFRAFGNFQPGVPGSSNRLTINVP